MTDFGVHNGPGDLLHPAEAPQSPWSRATLIKSSKVCHGFGKIKDPGHAG